MLRRPGAIIAIAGALRQCVVGRRRRERRHRRHDLAAAQPAHAPKTAGRPAPARPTSPECSPATPSQFFTQAAGHPPVGFTQFIVTNKRPLGPTAASANSRTDPGRPARRPQRQPAGDRPVHDGPVHEQHLPADSAGRRERRHGLVGSASTAPVPPLTLVPVYNIVPDNGRTGPLRLQRRRHQRLPQSRRRMERRLPRGIHDRGAELTADQGQISKTASSSTEGPATAPS